MRARIFTTSRKETDITKKFSQLKAPTIGLEAKDSAEDIEIYVRGKVESLISDEELVLADLSLQDMIIQEPISKADENISLGRPAAEKSMPTRKKPIQISVRKSTAYHRGCMKPTLESFAKSRQSLKHSNIWPESA